MFGRQAILPVDFDDGKHPNATAVLERLEKDDGIKYKETAEVLMSHRKNVLERVKSNIIKAQKKQKEEYDKKHANSLRFKVEATVLAKDMKRKKRKGGKLDSKWLGPFTIAQDLGKGFYQLKSIINPQKIIERINGTHLKIYKSPGFLKSRKWPPLRSPTKSLLAKASSKPKFRSSSKIKSPSKTQLKLPSANLPCKHPFRSPPRPSLTMKSPPKKSSPQKSPCRISLSNDSQRIGMS